VNYLDFILEIGAGRGRAYPVFVIGSPAGEAHDFMRFPFDARGLENQLLALQTALLRSGSKHRKIISPEEQTVQNFGQALFDALFIGEVRSCYDVSQREAFHQDKGLRIKLCIQSPELASLPWEFLYDKRKAEYICFSSNTPIVRYLELPQPPPPIGVTLPLSILGVVASPKDLPELDIEHEKYRVEKSLERLRNFHDLELDSEDAPTLLSLVQTWADTGIRQSIVSPSTYNQRISSIRSFYKFALMEGWISINPLEMVKMREDHTVKEVKPIEIEIEIEKVKNALKSIPCFTPSGKRDYAILSVLLTTGAGCGEIARMRYGDLVRTVSSATITTRQKHGKKGIYTLGKGTAQALIDYLAAIYDKEYPEDTPLWLSFAHYRTGLAIGKQSISDICKKWLDTTQVESTNRIYEAIKKEYGVKGIENIEKLLGINVEEEVSN